MSPININETGAGRGTLRQSVVSRRMVLRLIGGAVGVGVLTACSNLSPAPATSVEAVASSASDAGAAGAVAAGSPPASVFPTSVRLATVFTPADSGLLAALLPDFERESGLRVEVYEGKDIYDRARAGEADLLISHYGFEAVAPFVQDGLGHWPRTVFSNQVALLGPANDPARVRGLADATQAFRQIAETSSPFMVNNGGNVKYLEDVLWYGAGQPEKGSWYIDLDLRQDAAVQEASRREAYILWGAIPFLQRGPGQGGGTGRGDGSGGGRGAGQPRESGQPDQPPLEPLVLSDPILHRIMVSIVVNPGTVPGVNSDGATALQQYLLRAETQARILAYRDPSVDQPLWWPAARDNDPAVLAT